MSATLTRLPDAGTTDQLLSLAWTLADVTRRLTADPYDYEGLSLSRESLELLTGIVEFLGTLTGALGYDDTAAALAADGQPVPAPSPGVPVGGRFADLVGVARHALALYQAWDFAPATTQAVQP